LCVARHEGTRPGGIGVKLGLGLVIAHVVGDYPELAEALAAPNLDRTIGAVLLEPCRLRLLIRVLHGRLITSMM
jgi:hypothetical protein